MGSGPFAIAAWPESGRLRLTRRRDGRPLELVAVKDPNVRVMKLLCGEVSMLQGDLSPELVSYLDRSPGVRVTRAPGVNSVTLWHRTATSTGRMRPSGLDGPIADGGARPEPGVNQSALKLALPRQVAHSSSVSLGQATQ